MKRITKKCECGKTFSVFLSLSKAKYCSRKCFHRFRDYNWKSNFKKQCKCGKDFRVYPYRKDVASFCSRSCSFKYRRYRAKGYKCLNGSIAKIGNKNPMWGKFKPNGTLNSLHFFIHRRLDESKPKKCEHCKEEKKLEMANKSRKYKRSLNDWLWLCKRCHFKYDGAERYLLLGRGHNKNKKLIYDKSTNKRSYKQISRTKN